MLKRTGVAQFVVKNIGMLATPWACPPLLAWSVVAAAGRDVGVAVAAARADADAAAVFSAAVRSVAVGDSDDDDDDDYDDDVEGHLPSHGPRRRESDPSLG